ncbi:MAG: asparagine synthase (glutamine-hydrolyzing) [Pseudomonadota bacterium]
MCGIAGLWNRDGRPVDNAVLGAMTDSLAHRGPDDRDVWVDGAVGLGHRRLAILDLSADGRQPMSDETGAVTITYNGEIYNFKDLRARLEREGGYRFNTECDSEIIPIGYRHWGLDLFGKLEGMFAIALWDHASRRLVLARDGIGIKPLYVSRRGPSLYFASEVKAFQPIGDRFAIDPAALHVMLANGYPPPHGSLVVGIDQVPPGTVRVFDEDPNGNPEDHVFWRPSRQPSIGDMGVAVDAVERTLCAVVGDMLQSDVPVGILQSGGIDSTLIATASPSPEIPLFTARFQEGDFDETPVAEKVAKDLGRPHRVIPVTAIDDPVDTFKAMARAYDGQLADSSGFAFFELCRAVRREVTVALSGEGGDEFFAGYPTYRASRLAASVRSLLPSAVWEKLGLAGLMLARRNQTRLPGAEKFARFCLGIAASRGFPHPEWRRQVFEPHRRGLYGPELTPYAGADPMTGYRGAIQDAARRYPDEVPTGHRLVGDQSFYLPGDLLVKADRISMAHGLEVRVPFLDRRIMDLAGQIDIGLMTSLKGPDKRVLREALGRTRVGDAVVNHPKRGFMVPIAEMLRSHLRPLCRDVFDAGPDRFEPFLDSDAVRRLWREHEQGRANHKYALWLLLTLGVWLESHV